MALIGLIDADLMWRPHANGRRYGKTKADIYPNLALMKLSAWHKQKGDEVEWYNGLQHYDKVYVSKVFSTTPVSREYINADIIVCGGSGFNIHLENGKEVWHDDVYFDTTKQIVQYSHTLPHDQQMDFDEFCDYLAQDSTVGAADVSAVMKQLEKKLPLILAMGTKVQISAEGMTVKPTVSGSLTQADLKAKLEKRVADGETGLNVNRTLEAADLTVNDLTAGVSIDFSKKFQTAFGQNATFKRVSSGTAEAGTTPSTPAGGGDEIIV